MLIGVVTRNPEGWAPQRLARAAEKLGHTPFLFKFTEIIARIGFNKPDILVRGTSLFELGALIVRPLGRCSLDKAVFRLDLLYALHDSGVKVVNPPSAIEKAIDKYRALYILSNKGIPVPRTVVSENPDLATQEGSRLGKSVVVKPLFGSRGLGSTRVRDKDTLWRILHAIAYFRFVPYVQEYLNIKGRDMRLFVIGGEVVAAMYREHRGHWKTNIAQGARPIPFKPEPHLEELAIKATEALGCEIAGVDLAEVDDKVFVLEVNSQPGWRGLQSVTRVDIAEKIIEYIASKMRK